MDSEYDEDSEPNQEDPDDYKPSFKKMTKNQKIYGDFEYAYEPQVSQDIFSRKVNAYEQFKAGATIETYSSEVEVDLPISKPKKKTPLEEEDDKPMLGKFSLNSFLNSLAGNDELRDIVEEDNEDSSQNLPEGLNEKIIAHLQLVKFGEEQDEEEPEKLENMSYEAYMKTNKPKVPKVQPKYKTQEEKDLAHQFNASYGVGFKMLEKMGFKVAKGLGKQETGIQRPVQAVMKTAFTMKDEPVRKAEKEESSEQEEETQQIPIPQKVFQYRSKDRKINNFLLDLKSNYERLESQIYTCEAQIASFKKEEELNESLRCQSENQVKELDKQVAKLQQLGKNLYSCELYPHLGLYYKLDLLYVREVYDNLLNADFATLCAQGEPKLQRLVESLRKFYLAKAKETLRDYDESTGIESKFHRQSKGKKQKDEVIDLDSEEKVTIAFEDQEKIGQFVEVIISKCVLPKLSPFIQRVNSIEHIVDLRVLNVLDFVKKLDRKGTLFKEYTNEKIIPKCRFYLENVSLEDLESGARKYPHQVIFPWLTIVRPQDLNLLGFYRRIAGRLWSIENASLYSLLSPWVKFSTPEELAFLQNFYLAPRLLHELQQFNISQARIALLNGFTQYSELLTFKQREEILENSLLLQVLSAYRKYKESMGAQELSKWLSRWRKFTDKVSPGFFKGFFKEYAVVIE